jgi:hypothetical protein
LDFINKACECLDIIGWQEASAVLPTVVGQLAAARGGEEQNAWPHPRDLVALCETASAELPDLRAAGSAERGLWQCHAELARQLLADDPQVVVVALADAIRSGATAADLGRALAYAAALRVAWFGTANEHSDWEPAHHAFTYCNALHRLLTRITAERPVELESPELLHGVIHGAMRHYLIRFLNVPAARLPGEAGDRLDDLPSDGRGFPRLPDARGWSQAIPGMGRRRRRESHPDRGGGLSRRPFANRTDPAADRDGRSSS